MDMGFDQAAAAQAALRVIGGRVRDKLRLDRGDFSLGEADIDGTAVGCSRYARVADHVVEHERAPHLRAPFDRVIAAASRWGLPARGLVEEIVDLAGSLFVDARHLRQIAERGAL